MTAGDGGASLTARSERGAAGAALGGRGERAEKADSGAPQPHIEGTLIYVIARCLPGTDVVVTRHAEQRGGVAKSWLEGRGRPGTWPGHNAEFPWVRAATGAGYGECTQGMLGPEGTCGRPAACPLSRLPGVARV